MGLLVGIGVWSGCYSRVALPPLWEVVQLVLFCGVCNYTDRGCVVFKVNQILGTARPSTLLMA